MRDGRVGGLVDSVVNTHHTLLGHSSEIISMIFYSWACMPQLDIKDNICYEDGAISFWAVLNFI